MPLWGQSLKSKGNLTEISLLDVGSGAGVSSWGHRAPVLVRYKTRVMHAFDRVDLGDYGVTGSSLSDLNPTVLSSTSSGSGWYADPWSRADKIQSLLYALNDGFHVEFFDPNIKTVHDDFDWIDSIYEIDIDSQSPKDLGLLYEKLGGYLGERRFGAIDELIKRIDLDRSPTLILIGLLRRLYPAHEKLSEWAKLVANICVVLKGRDQDTTQMLRGLLG